jgi:hypothetical protein
MRGGPGEAKHGRRTFVVAARRAGRGRRTCSSSQREGTRAGISLEHLQQPWARAEPPSGGASGSSFFVLLNRNKLARREMGEVGRGDPGATGDGGRLGGAAMARRPWRCGPGAAGDGGRSGGAAMAQREMGEVGPGGHGAAGDGGRLGGAAMAQREMGRPALWRPSSAAAGGGEAMAQLVEGNSDDISELFSSRRGEVRASGSTKYSALYRVNCHAH